ncbi:hypothetical protein K438DRAFT_1747180 [Mycena galopus ATCC 62051]|nr:hypothetical protein K438DRAFT_1747180 [Mycena galopus ATCC 62051]
MSAPVSRDLWAPVALFKDRRAKHDKFSALLRETRAPKAVKQKETAARKHLCPIMALSDDDEPQLRPRKRGRTSQAPPRSRAPVARTTAASGAIVSGSTTIGLEAGRLKRQLRALLAHFRQRSQSPATRRTMGMEILMRKTSILVTILKSKINLGIQPGSSSWIPSPSQLVAAELFSGIQLTISLEDGLTGQHFGGVVGEHLERCWSTSVDTQLPLRSSDDEIVERYNSKQRVEIDGVLVEEGAYHALAEWQKNNPESKAKEGQDTKEQGPAMILELGLQVLSIFRFKRTCYANVPEFRTNGNRKLICFSQYKQTTARGQIRLNVAVRFSNLQTQLKTFGVQLQPPKSFHARIAAIAGTHD